MLYKVCMQLKADPKGKVYCPIFTGKHNAKVFVEIISKSSPDYSVWYEIW